MKFVQKGTHIVVDRGLTDDADLLERLRRELMVAGFDFTATEGRNRVRLPRLTLVFPTVGVAQRAEHWIEEVFEV